MENKKAIRKQFRDQCFKRDKYKCVICGFQSTIEKAENELDCHHITSRKKFLNGGYVKENGISLCKGEDGISCHEKAEAYLNGEIAKGYSPQELYAAIGSSLEKVLQKEELV